MFIKQQRSFCYATRCLPFYSRFFSLNVYPRSDAKMIVFTTNTSLLFSPCSSVVSKDTSSTVLSGADVFSILSTRQFIEISWAKDRQTVIQARNVYFAIAAASLNDWPTMLTTRCRCQVVLKSTKSI